MVAALAGRMLSAADEKGEQLCAAPALSPETTCSECVWKWNCIGVAFT
jgi:hypothetical protein